MVQSSRFSDTTPRFHMHDRIRCEAVAACGGGAACVGPTSHQAIRTITPPVPELFMHWAWPGLAWHEGKQANDVMDEKSQLCRDRGLASTWVRKGAMSDAPRQCMPQL